MSDYETDAAAPEEIAKLDCVMLSNSAAEALCQAVDESIGEVNVDLGTMAWVWFVLRKLPDSPSTFPRGKWATIHHIEAQLEELAELKATSRPGSAPRSRGRMP
jgi:hypothetical protein